MYQKYLEPIVEEFTTGEFYKEVYLAKKEYFDKAGVVYEDDTEFEQRMCIFMDWYILDRDLPGIDLPPVKYFFRKKKTEFSDEEVNIYKDLCNTIHSLFRLKKIHWGKKGFTLTDLFSNKSYKVSDSHMSQGFTKGDIFEGRIVPFKDTFEFSRGFCFHPVEMQNFILSEIKKVKFQPKQKQTKLTLQLSAMKLKHLRFNHIDVKHIYAFDSKF